MPTMGTWVQYIASSTAKLAPRKFGRQTRRSVPSPHPHPHPHPHPFHPFHPSQPPRLSRLYFVILGRPPKASTGRRVFTLSWTPSSSSSMWRSVDNALRAIRRQALLSKHLLGGKLAL
ncbi:hypothetical protein K504DRAFT_282476 [Pleomassaria siparia CBS 279.74]|uniref:Uncharacterized protein n=1 Tax=Pleomassaria siparia CBS 279.74 TaxID=1314801 RepID=A0A6G1KAE1_9PLEO|nr:hypothetical protein K504DRAFT_282476 [Pleomassaria siparia CBS 279.74]